MATDKRLNSDLAVPPGEYLGEVLAAKGMTQAELARRTGRPVQAINEIIKGDKVLTAATALQLEKALGVPAHIWTGLESQYQLAKANEAEKRLVQRELPYLRNTPYRQLAQMGCVKQTRNVERKISELHRFYGVASLVNLPETWASVASFRRSTKWDASSYALAAWLRCAELRAVESLSKDFSKAELRAALAVIRALTERSSEAFLPELARRLAACGVVLVLLPHFPKTYAHGATFWPNAEKAVLVLSIRGRWADIFWFSLFHEIGHLLLHKKTMFVDDGSRPAEQKHLEEEADQFAANLLIPADKLREFLTKGDLDPAAIRVFAEELRIAAGIVVGRLQHDGAIGHDSDLNRLRERYEWSERA